VFVFFISNLFNYAIGSPNYAASNMPERHTKNIWSYIASCR